MNLPEGIPRDDAQLSERLELARSLVAHLESGDDDDAAAAIATLAGFRDSQLFLEVGRLARELHESIKEFMLDERLVDLAKNEMPDAAERLRYVITMTEQAANTTLSAVEQNLPLADQLRANANELAGKWQKFNAREMTVADFRLLSDDLQRFLEVSQEQAGNLHDGLSEVLMAQGFQDLTGQIIRKVIELVGDVEGKLVELVRLAGQGKPDQAEPVGDAAASERDVNVAGPVVPGVDKGDVVTGQDDVDDLLSSLGF